MIFDPFFIDGDIAFKKVHARMVDQVAQTLGLHIHAVDFPVCRFQNTFGQMMTDKTVHAENEDFFHGEFFLNVNVGLCRMTQSDCDQAAPVNCFNSLTGIGFPSQ
jgi:hypothetical protein